MLTHCLWRHNLISIDSVHISKPLNASPMALNIKNIITQGIVLTIVAIQGKAETTETTN